MTTAPMPMQRPIAPEDQARADFYALLARLYAGPPDAALLADLGATESWTDDGVNPLAGAWNRLVLASRTMDAQAADDEYTSLFIGVGKSECNLYASYWINEATLQRPLVGVRADLAKLGLARQSDSVIYEDHLAALCEIMRILIVGLADRQPEPVATQKAFFERRIGPWVFDCCSAICESQVADYYRYVASFTHCFLAVERDSLAIE
ncbi:MAG: molecular chaperone TorD family protein [Burkholderiales bacterium]|nr:molecular chaperone TorD family protein [Burkholderiales bacterium]